MPNCVKIQRLQKKILESTTNYNYNKVSEMLHDGTDTLKKWYGKPSKSHIEKMFDGVVV